MRLDSWPQARKAIPAILERINADPALALAAAANPILALAELGYDITPGLEQEFSDRLRFGTKGFEERSALRDQIFAHAGHPFDIDHPDALHEVLVEELKIEPKGRSAAPPSARQLEVPRHVRRPSQPKPAAAPPADPLRALEGQHPIIAPLLRYRDIERSQPPLATRDVYQSIRTGAADLPTMNLTARLKRQPADPRRHA